METVEVVIKIPKEVYDAIIKDIEQENWYDEDAPIDKTMRAIANGTVLSKGHKRLGDLDELHDIFKKACDAYNINNLSFMSDMDMNFDLAPTIIEADREDE